MSSSKHILDLREIKRKKNNSTKPQPTRDDKSYLEFLSQKPEKPTEGFFNFDTQEIKEDLKDSFQKRDWNNNEEPKDRLNNKRPEFNIESGFVADLKYSITSWRERRRKANNQHRVDLSRHARLLPVAKEKGIIYLLISYFGWLIEKLFSLFFYIFKLIKIIIFSPITFLDRLLDGIAYILKIIIRLVFVESLRLIDAGYQKLKKIEFQLPYLWYKKVGTFTLIAVLVIAPIKIFFEVPKILNAQQEVLGISTKALNYFGLFNELQGYVPAALVVKEIGGFNGPKRYLLVFQNNAELRATGGFMGSYALVDVKAGEIERMDVPAGGFYDLKGYITRQVEAPQPFHIFSPYWQIWNANWFADFPTSARKLAQLYENSTGPTVDGVIAVTPNVIEELLELVGPIELPEYDVIIDADNFRRQTQVEVEYEYDKEANTPKAFIGALAPELLGRTFAIIDQGDTKALLKIIDRALEEKQLLLYSTSDEIQTTIEELNWGGSIRQTPQDYFQVVHTNIGGGKTDLVITDTIQQTLSIEEDGSVISEVTLTRLHSGDPEDLFEGHDNLDYMRFYVPAGSKLLYASGFTQDDISDRYKVIDSELDKDPELLSLSNAVVDLNSGMQIFEESERAVFGNWLGLKAGQSKSVTVRYKLPYKVEPGGVYHLYWQKQSGTQGTPIGVKINLPEGKQFINWLPQDSHVQLKSDHQLWYSNDLRTDRYLTFSYK